MKSVLCALALGVALAETASAGPKLILAIVVDQFRYDYLVRFRSSYNGGLDRLLTQGAVFTNAHYEHFPTVTAVGHATFLTGATPSIHGIIGNEWYDRELGRQVYDVFDPNYAILGASGREASSPRRLLVSSLGDELKMSGKGRKVIGISFKDRSAILPAGRMADAAYWFDNRSGQFVSSTYYFPEMPGWVKQFNDSRAADRFLGAEWRPLDNPAGKPYKVMANQADGAYYAALQATPYSNELIAALTERAIEAEQLGGAGGGVDLLTISFSGNDYIGHALGPDSPEVRDASIRTDRLLGKLFDFAEARAGRGQVLVVLTADHGVAPMPEVQQQRKMSGGRMPEGIIQEKIQASLTQMYGAGQWVLGRSGPAPYLNYDLFREKKLDLAEVRRVAAEAARAVPHVFRVYTRDQLLNGQTLDDQIDRRVRNGVHAQRGADLFIVAEPYWLFTDRGTSHGSPHNYDSHVPLIFLGPGIRPGRYHRRVMVNDAAPTLATLLEVETPSGSVGRVLEEILETR